MLTESKFLGLICKPLSARRFLAEEVDHSKPTKIGLLGSVHILEANQGRLFGLFGDRWLEANQDLFCDLLKADYWRLKRLIWGSLKPDLASVSLDSQVKVLDPSLGKAPWSNNGQI